jgi:hypothetical protein
MSYSAFSFYWVVDFIAGGNDGILNFNDGANNFDLLCNTNEKLRWWNGTGNTTISKLMSAGKRIIEAHRTSGGTFTVYQNGSDITATGSPNESTAMPNLTDAFGTPAWESNKKQGDILVFPSDLNGSGDAATVRTYLNDKWNLY